MDGAQRRAGAQLAVSHIEKAGVTHKETERLPGFPVGAGVFSVSVGNLEVDRHPLLGDGEDPQKLFQIWPVILVVAEENPQGGLSAHRSPVGLAVRSREGDGGGVVVQFLRGNGELLDHVQDERRQKRTAVGVEQTIEGPPDAVVVELLRAAAEEQRVEWARPFDDRIQRGAADDQAAEESAEGGDGVHAAARIGRGKVGGEQIGQLQPRQDAVDDGKCSDGLGIQAEGSITCHGVDTSMSLLYITVIMRQRQGGNTWID